MRAGTVFALSTAPGKAGIAVIRISGPEAGAALRALAGRPLLPPRRAGRARLRHPASGEPLDHGLVLWFPAPHSYTGEDMAELHLHGGRAVVAGVIEALAALPGLRPAEAGEFTRRAFENGKLDLTAAEGLADLVAAETAVQRRQALRQSEGALARLYEGWREELLSAMSLAEAEIDFADQELPPEIRVQIHEITTQLLSEITRHLADEGRGERLREGVSVVILGPPNAGKSSLLNLLSRREAAIVAESAGTTRDVIEVALDLGGYPVTVADTAGLRTIADAVESEGVRRALARAAKADLKLVVFDGANWPAADRETLSLADGDALIAVNKADLWGTAPMARAPAALSGRMLFPISCKTGAGIASFLAALEAEIGRRYEPGEAPAITRARHREALEECLAALRRFADQRKGEDAAELRAEDLRLAVRALGRITGRVDVEDVLDRIFSQFCIGK